MINKLRETVEGLSDSLTASMQDLGTLKAKLDIYRDIENKLLNLESSYKSYNAIINNINDTADGERDAQFDATSEAKDIINKFYDELDAELDELDAQADNFLAQFDVLRDEMTDKTEMLKETFDNCCGDMTDATSTFTDLSEQTRETLNSVGSVLTDSNALLNNSIDVVAQNTTETVDTWLDDAEDKINALSGMAESLAEAVQAGTEDLTGLLQQAFAKELHELIDDNVGGVMNSIDHFATQSTQAFDLIDGSLGEISRQLEPVADVLDAMQPAFDVIGMID